MPRMRNTAFIFFILLSTVVNAQGGWKRKYNLSNSGLNLPWGVFECLNGDFIEAGLILDTLSNPPEYKLNILSTNSQGDLLWTKSTAGGKFIYLDCFSYRSLIYEGNNFYLATTVIDTTNKQMGMLIKFDLNGDTLWRKVYKDPNSLEDVIIFAFTKSVDGGFLLTGFFQDATSNTCLVIKTDSNGNEIWRQKIHKNYPDVQAGHAIIQDSLTKKIVIVGYQYLTSSSNIGTYSNILILDQYGNKLTQTTMNNFDGGPFSEIIQLKDKNFLTCGSENANNDLGNTTRYNSVVVKFDILGNLIWKKKYDTLDLYNRIDILNELPNGDIVMSGVLDTCFNYNLDIYLKIKILKTNSNGEIKWRKYIGSSYDHISSEGPLNMSPTKDHGFILSSRFVFEPDPKSYSIIKIDSTGCDTIEAWCVSVALGISDFSKAFGYSSELFPNPAKDFVNIKLEASLDKSFTVQISDVSGKEIETLKIQPNENFVLRTAAYKNGIYFMTVFYEGRRVETKKLVVLK